MKLLVGEGAGLAGGQFGYHPPRAADEPSATLPSAYEVPSLWDEDNDLELAVGSYDYAVYVLDLPAQSHASGRPAQPRAPEWPMFHYDPARTGFYPSQWWLHWLPVMLKGWR